MKSFCPSHERNLTILKEDYQGKCFSGLEPGIHHARDGRVFIFIGMQEQQSCIWHWHWVVPDWILWDNYYIYLESSVYQQGYSLLCSYIWFHRLSDVWLHWDFINAIDLFMIKIWSSLVDGLCWGSVLTSYCMATLAVAELPHQCSQITFPLV